jgi:hypothetical protein
MLRIDLRGAMFELRRGLEHSIRTQASEYVVLQAHDAVYLPVRRALEPIHGAVAEAIREALGLPPEPDRLRTALAELRRLLDENAKERELERVAGPKCVGRPRDAETAAVTYNVFIGRIFIHK